MVCLGEMGLTFGPRSSPENCRSPEKPHQVFENVFYYVVMLVLFPWFMLFNKVDHDHSGISPDTLYLVHSFCI